ncbi:Rha family transcriptional regulator [Oleidesulfovibrio alaskensis]|jgi:hypothetical protein|uniref:Rha family transcriptional regulator n=1 Tax=Oleidesulfovibrio alaskensis TaxID=58180 RepID=UPI000486789E|nr:Rha family transcriptional regulator [Oleidesulfovibrio alaskensis]
MDPMYLMTLDGFTFLAMGFNGARAAEFKIKYIEALECSVDFRKPNFGLSSYSVPNKRLPYPMHLMTSTASLSSQRASPFLSSRFSFPLILPIPLKIRRRKPQVSFHISFLRRVSPRPYEIHHDDFKKTL